MQLKRRCGRGERGIALVAVLFAATMILLLLLTMLTMTELSGRVVARQLTSNGQALNAASAGLNEGLSWFVRQPPPVTVFAPKLDLSATPPVNETDDPATGLVRSYEISSPGRVWGRYTLPKSKIVDISKQRGKTEDGLVWALESEGLVYIRNDKTKAPDQSPNVVIARSTMHGDIERLGLAPPAPAAINAIRGDNVNISASGRVQGGTSIGVAYPAYAPIKNKGTVTGTPAIVEGGSVKASAFALDKVFGVSQQELMAMADLVVSDEKDLPHPMPNMALIVIRGNATFTPQQPLTGSGILVVLGNLVVNPQSNSFFNGAIWAGGTVNISPPTVINGTLIAQNNVTLSAGSEISEVNYDKAILDQVRLQKGSFAFSRTPWIADRIGD